ncbi:OmpA family protein [Maribacter antarcticus]|uniref:OmpA family protein n=1 Tax=Maribacter antarcticus TaxID=505250 RepID=UPI00047AAEA1|nr:OmpA family protein [Maribacter antarcticus]
MKWNIFLIFFSTATFLCLGQENRSKGDNYFYAYEYQNAIEAYTKQRLKHPLSDSQNLNLADAYFKMESYKNASKLYLEGNKKDTTMSVHRFNKMLQSLTRTSDKERVITFLRTKSTVLSSELIENSSFNYELMEGGKGNLHFNLFNVPINSPQADTSPAFYKDELLFSSSRFGDAKNTYIPTGESYLDIYAASIDENGAVNNASTFSKIPFSEFHKSTPYYSVELQNIFYILSNTEDDEMAFDDNGKNALSLGMLDKSGGFRFLLRDLSTSFYYPFFDAESNRLYFSANFDDSYGGTDIYYVTTNNGQIMSAPTNLGPRINSPGNEISPYLFKGDFYFSSDVFYGLGGMDVYKSNITLDSGYSIPVNLGKGINTPKDDFGFIIKESGEDTYLGYLASNREGGKGGDDIYGFKINGIPGLKTFALRGKTLNSSSNDGISQVQITVLNTTGEIIKELSSKEAGAFSLEIPWQEGITIKASKEKHSMFSMSLTPEQMRDLKGVLFNIGFEVFDDLVEEKEGQKVIKLSEFYFDKGKSVVNAAIALELDKVVEMARKFPEIRLAIATHTDSKGSSSSNLKLSQSRSKAIQSYLIKKGVSQTTIVEALGYGEEKLTNNCVNGAYCLDFLHKQNERTFIKIVR